MKKKVRGYMYICKGIPNHDLHGGDLFLIQYKELNFISKGEVIWKDLQRGLSQISAKNYINKTYFRKEETGFLPPMCKNTLCLKG